MSGQGSKPFRKTEVFMLSVLMIDSLPEQSSLIGGMLQDWGHSVTVASTGASALLDGAQGTWHLVFIGLEKLSEEGVEWIPRMRRAWPDALLIVIGDLDQPDLERRVRTQGVDFYLQKASDLPRLKILMQHFEKKCFCPKDAFENWPKTTASDGQNLLNGKEKR
jgi:DNA-binding response OmpR family regulator